MVLAATSSASKSSVSFYVLFAEHESGGRLRTNDGIAVPHRVGEHSQICQGLIACVIDVANQKRPPGPSFAGGGERRR